MKKSFGTWFMSLLAGMFGGGSGGNSNPSPTTNTTTTSSTTTREDSLSHKNKKALCIAINDYPGTGNDLKGCVNDANGWKQMLESSFGFMVDIMLNGEVTRANVRASIKELFSGAIVDDHLVITYSGHGSQTPDRNRDEADGKDETWYLCDGHFLDDEIKSLIGSLPAGVRITVISDSCHSGTVTRGFISALAENELKEDHLQPRYMPPEDDNEVLELAALPVTKRNAGANGSMPEVLLSGCQSTEYSYDARFNGRNMGAFSHFALLTLRDNPNITYRQFYKKVRKNLPSSRYPQTPQLEGADANLDRKMFT